MYDGLVVMFSQQIDCVINVGLFFSSRSRHTRCALVTGFRRVLFRAVQSRSPVVIRSSPGERMALHSTALGKALLVGLSDDAIGEILGDAPLEPLTPRTVSEPGQPISQLRTAQAIGSTTSDRKRTRLNSSN